MEEQKALEQAGAELVGQLTEWLRQGGELVGEQAPLVMQDMLTWGMISYGSWVLITSLGFVVFATLSRFAWKDKVNEGAFESLPFFGGAAIITFSLAVNKSLSFLKVLLAPRVYLLEQLTSLL